MKLSALQGCFLFGWMKLPRYLADVPSHPCCYSASSKSQAFSASQGSSLSGWMKLPRYSHGHQASNCSVTESDYRLTGQNQPVLLVLTPKLPIKTYKKFLSTVFIFPSGKLEMKKHLNFVSTSNLQERNVAALY